MDVKISKDCMIPKVNVSYYASYDVNMVRLDVREKKKNTELVKDFTRGKKVNTVIYLKSGEMLLTNLSLETISTRMREGDEFCSTTHH